ncbi:MAG TPA: 3-oxoacyl-ACP reductase FabG [Anaerolineae bacterium]|nr:3-oxoacyl-ACP reductase FabG [Anaerolineae bacterium]
MAKLKDRVALVTGAGRGIGREIALALAREGAHVTVNYAHSAEGARATVEEARALGVRAIALQADVSRADQVEAMVQRTVDELGRLDVLVNNAAIFSSTPLFEVTEALWDEILAVNLKGVFLCARAAARVMLAQGAGVIVNIASGGGLDPYPGYRTSAPYAASKAGVIMLTRVLARELAPQVRVNCVAPGIVDSKARPMSKAAKEKFSALTPLGRVGEPADIADVVVFLASDDARFMTGQTLSVDGGLLMR